MVARWKLEMRRKSASQGKLDSDESLSDEDDLREVAYDNDCSENLQSLYSRGKKVQSTPSQQVESLTGDSHHPTIAAYGVDLSKTNPSTLPKEQEILSSQSEIRDHLFEMENRKLAHFNTKKVRLGNSGYESILDEETGALPRFPFTYVAARVDRDLYTHLEKDSQQEACEWPAILEEANKLAGLQKTCNSSNTSDVTEVRRFHKGKKRSPRFKFSIQSLSRTENLSWACSWSKDETYNSCEEDIEGPAEWVIAEHGKTENAMPHLLENILEDRAEQANKPGFHIQHVGAPSVSELLENLQKKSDPFFMRNLAVGNIKARGRPMSYLKRTLQNLGNRFLDNKDPPEFTVGDISSEDEFNDQDYETDQIFEGHTMADLFQEAFKTSTMEGAAIPRSNKFGYLGRLQRVMQLEKERHMECLKQIQEGWTPSNDSHCINVKILSRTREAKLTVCQCLFAENSKLSECEDNQKRSEESCLLECSENVRTIKKTVIFTPKISSNVELEVGSIVCLHPPWKEVQVNAGEIIILCTYFSQRV